jgi:hypothetical protein
MFIDLPNSSMPSGAQLLGGDHARTLNNTLLPPKPFLNV